MFKKVFSTEILVRSLNRKVFLQFTNFRCLMRCIPAAYSTSAYNDGHKRGSTLGTMRAAADEFLFTDNRGSVMFIL